MLSLGLSIISPAIMRGGPVPIDADAQLIFDAFTTPPTDARKITINTCVLALKAAGVWSALDILYVLAAADAQAARINWKNPGVKTLTAVNAPAFAADRGYTGNGTSSRLDTAWVPSTDGVNFTQDNASMWIWSRTSGQSALYDQGNISGAFLSALKLRGTTDVLTAYLNDAGTNVSSVTDASGFFGVQRPAAASKKVWRNGSQIGTAGTATTGIPPTAQWGLGANGSGFSVREESALAWGASVSGSEAAFYNAMLAYMQAVGAA
jgi:hypothetical protein